jgi:hypothetical protein
MSMNKKSKAQVRDKTVLEGGSKTLQLHYQAVTHPDLCLCLPFWQEKPELAWPLVLFSRKLLPDLYCVTLPWAVTQSLCSSLLWGVVNNNFFGGNIVHTIR